LFEEKHFFTRFWLKVIIKSCEDPELADKRHPEYHKRWISYLDDPVELERVDGIDRNLRDRIYCDKFFADCLELHGNSVTIKYMIELLEEALSA
jgi:hypothetical protein